MQRASRFGWRQKSKPGEILNVRGRAWAEIRCGCVSDQMTAKRLGRRREVPPKVAQCNRYLSPVYATLLRMRRAQVRKFLKDVGVGLEACGRTLMA
jgi:hypothetical protein